jgi:hypothetical protein
MNHWVMYSDATAGPICEVYDGELHQEGDTYHIPPGTALVAQVASCGSWEETQRRARLIAAAPDLLAALSEMLEMATDNRTHGAEIDAACAAIAKAEGGDTP